MLMGEANTKNEENTGCIQWSTLRHTTKDVLLLQNFKSTPDSYIFHVTDLRTVWIDSALKEDVIQRAIEDQCVVDIAQAENRRVLIGRLSEALNSSSTPPPGTSIDIDTTGEKFTITVTLNESSTPLKWLFRLEPSKSDTQIRDIVFSTLGIIDLLYSDVLSLEKLLSQKDHHIKAMRDYINDCNMPPYRPPRNWTALNPYRAENRIEGHKTERDCNKRPFKTVFDYAIDACKGLWGDCNGARWIGSEEFKVVAMNNHALTIDTSASSHTISSLEPSYSQAKHRYSRHHEDDSDDSAYIIRRRRSRNRADNSSDENGTIVGRKQQTTAPSSFSDSDESVVIGRKQKIARPAVNSDSDSDDAQIIGRRKRKTAVTRNSLFDGPTCHKKQHSATSSSDDERLGTRNSKITGGDTISGDSRIERVRLQDLIWDALELTEQPSELDERSLSIIPTPGTSESSGYSKEAEQERRRKLEQQVAARRANRVPVRRRF
ncbi:hypothetical protein V1512DRAFT_288436 [Lipomyces arxii]|uniref:uncharacterized protein n=1 Tax=Lipomyces arxii TaxID=56418 RepID=UPI0034D0199D